MNHSRFLLTGVRLSISSAPIPTAPPAEAELADNKSNNKEVKSESSGKESRDENVVVVEEVAVCSSSTTNTAAVDSNGSSISEYLIKMLPDWHVEDFLTDDVATTVDAGGSCHQANGDLLENSGLGGVAEGPQLFWGFVKEAKTSRQRWSEESPRSSPPRGLGMPGGR